MPDFNKQTLKDYVATANSGKYSSWEEVNSKFPELKGIDSQLLKDYVATANSGKYDGWEEINTKFPEFFDVKKKESTEPSSGGPEKSSPLQEEFFQLSKEINEEPFKVGKISRDPYTSELSKIEKKEEANLDIFNGAYIPEPEDLDVASQMDPATIKQMQSDAGVAITPEEEDKRAQEFAKIDAKRKSIQEEKDVVLDQIRQVDSHNKAVDLREKHTFKPSFKDGTHVLGDKDGYLYGSDIVYDSQEELFPKSGIDIVDLRKSTGIKDLAIEDVQYLFEQEEKADILAYKKPKEQAIASNENINTAVINTMAPEMSQDNLKLFQLNRKIDNLLKDKDLLTKEGKYEEVADKWLEINSLTEARNTLTKGGDTWIDKNGNVTKDKEAKNDRATSIYKREKSALDEEFKGSDSSKIAKRILDLKFKKDFYLDKKKQLSEASEYVGESTMPKLQEKLQKTSAQLKATLDYYITKQDPSKEQGGFFESFADVFTSVIDNDIITTGKEKVAAYVEGVEGLDVVRDKDRARAEGTTSEFAGEVTGELAKTMIEFTAAGGAINLAKLPKAYATMAGSVRNAPRFKTLATKTANFLEKAAPYVEAELQFQLAGQSGGVGSAEIGTEQLWNKYLVDKISTNSLWGKLLKTTTKGLAIGSAEIAGQVWEDGSISKDDIILSLSMGMAFGAFGGKLGSSEFLNKTLEYKSDNPQVKAAQEVIKANIDVEKNGTDTEKYLQEQITNPTIKQEDKTLDLDEETIKEAKESEVLPAKAKEVISTKLNKKEKLTADEEAIYNENAFEIEEELELQQQKELEAKKEEVNEVEVEKKLTLEEELEAIKSEDDLPPAEFDEYIAKLETKKEEEKQRAIDIESSETPELERAEDLLDSKTTDVNKLHEAYKEIQSEKEARKIPWQEELLTMKINQESFEKVTGLKKKDWPDSWMGAHWFVEKGGENIEDLTSEIGVDLNDIKDFIEANPLKQRITSDTEKAVVSRYRELTGKSIKQHNDSVTVKPAFRSKLAAEKTVGEKIQSSGKDLASKIRSYKRKFDPGELNDIGKFVAEQTFNNALEAAAITIEATSNLAKGVADAISYLKSTDYYKSLSDQKKKRMENLVETEVTKYVDPEYKPASSKETKGKDVKKESSTEGKQLKAKAIRAKINNRKIATKERIKFFKKYAKAEMHPIIAKTEYGKREITTLLANYGKLTNDQQLDEALVKFDTLNYRAESTNLDKQIDEELSKQDFKKENGVKKAGKLSTESRTRMNNILNNEDSVSVLESELNDLSQELEESESPKEQLEISQKMDDVEAALKQENVKVIDSKIEKLKAKKTEVREDKDRGDLDVSKAEEIRGIDKQIRNLEKQKRNEKSKYLESVKNLTEKGYEDRKAEKLKAYEEDLERRRRANILTKKSGQVQLDQKEAAEMEMSIKERVFSKATAMGDYMDNLEGLIEKVVYGPGKTASEKQSNVKDLKEIIYDPIVKSQRKLETLNEKSFSMLQDNQNRIFGKDWKKKVKDFGSKNKKNLNHLGQVKLYSKDGSYRKDISLNNLTTDEILNIYNIAKTEKYRNVLIKKNGLSEDTLSKIEGLVDSDPQVKEYADWIVDEFYPSLYDMYNPSYKEVFGVDMPKEDLYVPVSGFNPHSNEGSSISPKGDVMMNKSKTVMSPGNIKERVESPSAAIDIRVGLQESMGRYMASMNHFAAYQPALKKIAPVINDKRFQSNVMRNNGKYTLKYLNSFYERIANNHREEIDVISKMLMFIKNRGVISSLGLNIKSAGSQLLSMSNFATEMNSAKFAKDFIAMFPQGEIAGGKGVFTNETKEIYERLKNSDFLKQRLGKGYDFDTAQAMKFSKNKMAEWMQKGDNIAMTLTKKADAFAILKGGSVYYKNQLDKYKKDASLTMDEAHEKALNDTIKVADSAQQSSSIYNKSALQSSTLGNLLTTFKTSQIQYKQQLRSAYRNIARGRSSARDYKRIMAYAVTQPALYYLYSSAFDFEDEDVTELYYRIPQAALGSNVNPLSSPVMDFAINRVMGKPFGVSVSPTTANIEGVVEKVGQQLQDVFDGKATWTDEEAVDKIYAPIIGITTGVPFKNAKSLTYDNVMRSIGKKKYDNWKNFLLFNMYATEGNAEDFERGVKFEKNKKVLESIDKKEKFTEEQKKAFDEGRISAGKRSTTTTRKRSSVKRDRALKSRKVTRD